MTIEDLQQRVRDLEEAVEITRMSGVERMRIVMETLNAMTTQMDQVYAKREVFEELKSMLGPPGIRAPTKSEIRLNSNLDKGADRIMPSEWAGPTSGKQWIEFEHGITNWATVLNQECVKYLQKAEGNEGDITYDMDALMEEFNAYLYSVLVKVTIGEPKVYVMNAGLGNGLKAWRELSTWYDPKGFEDRPAALEKVTSPPMNRARNNAEASKNLQEYEVMLRQCEQRFGNLNVDTKMVGLRKILPLGCSSPV